MNAAKDDAGRLVPVPAHATPRHGRVGGGRGRREPWAPPKRRLTFSPLAWLKRAFLMHAGETEVGGFGVSCERDPLYVRDLATVRQYVTAVGVRFDDAAVADHFDRMA